MDTLVGTPGSPRGFSAGTFPFRWSTYVNLIGHDIYKPTVTITARGKSSGLVSLSRF